MARGWVAGVSKLEYRAYKAACEASGIIPEGCHGFKAGLDSGKITHDFFSKYMSEGGVVKVGSNANLVAKRNDNGEIEMSAPDDEELESELIPITDTWAIKTSRHEWIIWKINSNGFWTQTAVGYRKIEDAIIYIARELQREKISAHKDIMKIGETNKEVFALFEKCIKQSLFVELEKKIRSALQ